jgi:hypothetical protein
LSDFQRLDLDRARIYRRHQFDAQSGNDVSVLLEVQHGDPVVVERKLDRGRVLVQSIPLGISWSTLPLCQAYVAMLHEWLWYLAEPALPKHNLAVGEAVTESANAKTIAELTLPDSRTVELQPAPSQGGEEFRYAATRLPGEYVLRSKTKESDAMSKDLVKRGFRFVGSTICYAFMQATGMVNDHLVECFRWKPLDQSPDTRSGVGEKPQRKPVIRPPRRSR